MNHQEFNLLNCLKKKLMPPKCNDDLFIQSCQIVHENHCFYIKMPSITVYLGYRFETAIQYVDNLHTAPKALLQLVLDSNEFGAAFIKHSALGGAI